MYIILTKFFCQIRNKKRYLKKLNHSFNLLSMVKILAFLLMDKLDLERPTQWKDLIQICFLIKLIIYHLNFLGFCQELRYLFKRNQKDKNVLERNCILKFLHLKFIVKLLEIYCLVVLVNKN